MAAKRFGKCRFCMGLITSNCLHLQRNIFALLRQMVEISVGTPCYTNVNLMNL